MIDTGNTGFMLIATALVMLMTPGLAFFYGGLVGRKNVLTIMMQSFVSLGVTGILWFAVGYSLSFSGGAGGIIGNLDHAFLRGITPTTLMPNINIPEYVFFAYQLMFAIITPALITGAFAGRVRFNAYLVFLVVWQLLVYYPFVHMVWGGGLLQQWGVLDFAGGIVVHNLAGFAALASVIFVGTRYKKDGPAHNIPFVALGTGLLWFGWYGFNAGSELKVDAVTGAAFVNTTLAACFGSITWLIMSQIFEKKPKFVGLLIGAVAGLATVTPACGFVTPTGAALIGALAGIVCYYACMLRAKWNLDDALDVWGCHGVGGTLGIIMLGLLATTTINPAGADGLLYGNPTFFLKEVVAVIFSSLYSFAFTYGSLWVINKVTPVRVTKEVENVGLDQALHGETAYEMI